MVLALPIMVIADSNIDELKDVKTDSKKLPDFWLILGKKMSQTKIMEFLSNDCNCEQVYRQPTEDDTFWLCERNTTTIGVFIQNSCSTVWLTSITFKNRWDFLDYSKYIIENVTTGEIPYSETESDEKLYWIGDSVICVVSSSTQTVVYVHVDYLPGSPTKKKD